MLQYVSELKSNLASDQAKAQVAQADPLAAIDLAGKALSDCEGEKVIVVYDNGLGTTNYLDLAVSPELLEADPDTVVEALKEACTLPDVDGCEIHWSFLGEVASPQEPLNKEQLVMSIPSGIFLYILIYNILIPLSRLRAKKYK